MTYGMVESSGDGGGLHPLPRREQPVWLGDVAGRRSSRESIGLGVNMNGCIKINLNSSVLVLARWAKTPFSFLLESNEAKQQTNETHQLGEPAASRAVRFPRRGATVPGLTTTGSSTSM